MLALLAALTLPDAAGASQSVPRALGAGAFPAQGPRSITVLNPVDLTSGLPDAASGRQLRRDFARYTNWQALPGDSAARMLREYGLDEDMPCMEFQCAFDAGNALQTEFVLFGTTASLPEMHTFNLGLVHVPTSQVVWSRTGDAPGGASAKGVRFLDEAIESAVAELNPADLNLRRLPSEGLLGVMDAGQSTPHSRVILHRALAHAYASRAYELLGPSELDELLAALDIPGGEASAATEAYGSPSKGGAFGDASGIPGGSRAGRGEDMVSMGTRVGVRYLLWTKVRNEGSGYSMDLSLYDVPGRKLIRHWPSKKPADFRSLLGIEDRFLTALGNEFPLASGPPKPMPSRVKILGKGATIGLSVLGGAALGYMAWQSKLRADAAYKDFGRAQSEQEAIRARRETAASDTRARRFGILGGVSFALGVAIWSF